MRERGSYSETYGYAEGLGLKTVGFRSNAPAGPIRTPGASEWIPEEYPSERIEYIAETGLALCHLPAAERTGLTAYSLHFPHHHQLPVYTLNGKERIPDPVLPEYAHPDIVPSGLGN
tara:strand:+ start:325 stop:675 length:351 start_codon:yes stop_codon:yes gene_type:complete